MALNSGYTYREQLPPESAGQTVLAYLSKRYRHSSAEEWLERIQQGEVKLDGSVVVADQRLKSGQILLWSRPPWQEPQTPQHYSVVYQDEALLAVDKPSGLPTMPAGGFLDNTLLTLVRHDFPQASPLHRLGRGTSGLVLFARTTQAAKQLSRAWREHEVKKHYLALASGIAAQNTYKINAAIGPVPHPRLGEVYGASEHGKSALSEATVLERRADSTLFAVEIHTGRPHQIRIHLAYIGHPLVGDLLYGKGGQPLPDLPGLPGDLGYFLHAARLEFVHPVSGENMRLETTPPVLMQV